jgi:MFS family permease
MSIDQKSMSAAGERLACRRAARSPLVLLLAAVLFLNYVDRGTMSTAAHLMEPDLGLNDAQMGILLSAFFWSYCFTQIPMGWLAERIGGHRVLAGALAVWALATMLLGLAHSFFMLLALRVLLGVGESAGFPCVSKIMAAAVPAPGLGVANGIVGFAYLLGPAVGTYAGGWLMVHFGWRSAFVVFGALSLLWLLPWSRVGGQVRAGYERSIAKDGPTFLMVLKTPAMWGTALGVFCSNYGFFFMLLWLPSYLVRERGFSTLEMAALTGSAFAVNALCALGAGWAIDHYIGKGGSSNFAYKSIMVVAHLGSAICLLCMAFGAKPMALVGMFVYQVLCGASSPGIYAMAQVLAGPKATGRWVGIQNSVGSLAGAISPYVTGEIIQHTGRFANALLVAAVVMAVGVVGWTWMLPTLKEMRWAPRVGAAVGTAPGSNA